MANQVAQFEQFRRQDQPLAGRINPITNVESGISELSRSREMATQNLFSQLQNQPQQQDAFSGPSGFEQGQEFTPSAMVNREDLPPITQTFGQRSKYDVFSGGVNYGVDYGVKEGTPLGLPAGQWQVIEAFGGAEGRGQIGDKTNRGYGNSVLVRNQKTGETLRLSHLQRVAVRPGQVIPGGTVIATSGATGNVTGPHLDVEYKDPSGNLGDVLRTPYANQLVGIGGGDSLGKGGGIGDVFNKAKQAYFQTAEPQENQPVRNFLRSNFMTTQDQANRSNEVRNKLVDDAGNITYDRLTPEEKRTLFDDNLSLAMGMTSPIKSRIGGDRVAMATATRLLNKGARNLDEFMVADQTINNLVNRYVPKRLVQQVYKKFPVGLQRTNALSDLLETYIKE